MNDLREAAQQALDSINELFAAEQSEGGERGGHIRTPATREHLVRVAQARRALHESCDTLRAALAQQAEPVKHQHKWFRTGAMEPGQMRCIDCGKWGKEQAEPVQPGAWVASKDGRVIYDDASTDDGLLRVSGDFENDEQRSRYAQRIVDKLNAALAQQAEPVRAPLKRGITGRCTRKVCECEKEGLGPECIYLEPVVDGYPLWSGIPKAALAEPVAHRAFLERILTAMEGVIDVADRKTDEFDALRSCVIDLTLMLHAAPPPRTMVPLTEEEIAALVRAEIEALPSYPSAVEELPYRLARAVEKASWEKNHGQA